MKRSVLLLLVFSAISLVATLLPRYIDRNISFQKLRNIHLEQKQEIEPGSGDPNNRNDSILLLMRREVEEIERFKNRRGSESAVVLDSVLKIIKEMISVYSEYESVMAKAFAALEFNAIVTPEDIGKSIESAKKAEIAANRMERLNKEMRTKLKESLAGSQESTSTSDTDPATRDFYQIANIERRDKLYTFSEEIMKNVQSALQVMEKEWGEWEYNEEEGGVLFESESAVMEFNDTMKQIGVLVQKIKELQLAILKAYAG